MGHQTGGQSMDLLESMRSAPAALLVNRSHDRNPIVRKDDQVVPEVAVVIHLARLGDDRRLEGKPDEILLRIDVLRSLRGLDPGGVLQEVTDPSQDLNDDEAENDQACLHVRTMFANLLRSSGK
jgi:hypothetical protein